MFSTTPWFLKGNFSKDSVIVIKTQNHTTTKRQNSWSYVTIRELQARKHNQISVTTCLLRKDKHSEKTNISWYQSWDIWVFLKQKSVSKLLTFENNPKVMKFHEKLSRKRWQVINFFSPLSSQNSSQNVLKLKPFNRFYIWYFETNISFQNSNTQTSFLKVSNNDRTWKLRKLTSS